MEHAPDTSERITLGIRDRLVAVESSPLLTYPVVCEAPDVQVMRVTYQPSGLAPGDVVLFGGGYSGRGKKQIIFAPCLASRE